MATHIGIMAMRRAAIPDGMVCSPHATIPIPPPSRNAPTIALSRHSRRVGATAVQPLRAADQPSRTRPAVTNRIAAITKGGMVSTAIAIPR